jgi:hypothetical protein
MNTEKFSTINHIISNDFKEILKPENNITVKCNKTTINPETEELLSTSLRTINKFYNLTNDMDYAIFPHHDLNDAEDKKHFDNCVKRFRKLVNYNTLFNYTFNTWENNPSIEELEELVSSLKYVHNFKNFKVCFIGIKKGLNSEYKKTISSEYYDVWELTIYPNSFTGGLFSNDSDNLNYIKIIESYDIEINRVSKEEIDSLPISNNSKYKYNSWPLGKVPKELQRPELDIIRQMGYEWSDPRDVIDMFEKKVAEFSGAKYAVSVDCCTHGIFLSLQYLKSIKEIDKNTIITIPSRTYISPPMQIIHSGLKVNFEDVEWSGIYHLKGTRIWDGAVRWTKDMYVGDNSLQIVSFQMKKRIPIGKGGVILTDDENAYKWLKLVSYDGRDLTTPYTDENHITLMGYHMYMTPEDAARGIILIDNVNKETEVHEDSGGHTVYTDVSEIIKKLLNK